MDKAGEESYHGGWTLEELSALIPDELAQLIGSTPPFLASMELFAPPMPEVRLPRVGPGVME